MAMKIEKINSDNRGDIYGYKIGNRQHIIVTFNEEGIARGGHYHKTNQWHICLAGKLNVKIRDVVNEIETERIMIESNSILIPAGFAHLFIAEEPSVLAESRIGDYEATDYEPYRKLARPK